MTSGFSYYSASLQLLDLESLYTGPNVWDRVIMANAPVTLATAFVYPKGTPALASPQVCLSCAVIVQQ